MSRLPCLIALILMAGSAGAAAAQAPSPSVEVTALAAPDAFTTPGRDTGLPATLWRGASIRTAKTVLPLLAAKPLSPAGAALARRILATGAPGPRDADRDPVLAAARANALMFQGDPRAAAAVLARAPGLDRNSDLARSAAETMLLSGDDQHACQLAQGLTIGRDEVYWLKLRTYCQAIAGHAAQAQLTFDLVQAQVKDPIFTRMMNAKLAGGGNPGAASLRNGLDYALSKSLGLDLAAAKASPAVAAALSPADPKPPVFDPAGAAPEVAPLADALAKGEPIRDALLGALTEAAGSTDPKARARGEVGLLLAVAVSGSATPEVRGQIAALGVPEGKAPVGRGIALEAAAEQKLMGEAALLSLWTCAEAGPAGPAIGDRVRIVRALHAVGLDADARAMAFEGLLALK
jgi:hypothetical protein